MSKQKIAFPAMQFPIAFFLALTLALTGCLDEPVSFEVRSGQTDGDNTGDDGGPDNDNDTGNGPGNNGTPDPNVQDGTDYVSGYWGSDSNVNTESRAANTSPAIKSQKLEIADNGVVFLSWTSTFIENNISREKLTTMRGSTNSSGAFSWSDPDSSMYQPAGINADAKQIQFFPNPENADGYAVWESGEALKISEFMDSMGHFMGTAELAGGHVPQVLTNSNGTAYLITQAHMQGGFGINAFTRTAVSSWSDPKALHRMDAGNEIQMPDHFLYSFVDGQDNILAIWLEQQGATMSLQSATYNTVGNSWGSLVTILDSSNTYGIDLASLKSAIAVGETNSSNIHLVLYQDTGAEKSIFSIDFHSANGGWQMPMRRDTQTVTSAMSADSNNGHMIVAWVISTAGMQSIKSIHFTPGTGWSNVMDVAMAKSGVTISDLNTALNTSGHVLVSWMETEGTEKRLLSSLQMPGQAWAQKELVKIFNNATVMQKPVIAMQNDGTPWMVWKTEQNTNGNISFDTRLIKRLTTINNTTPTSDTGSGDGHTDHAHDDDGSTGNGGTSGNGDTTNPDNSGNNDNGGTTDNGNDSGTGTDTGNNSGSTADPDTGIVNGLWGTTTSVNTVQKPVADQTMFSKAQIQTTSDGKLFAHWVTMSHANNARDIVLTLGSMDAAGNYVWSDPGNAMYRPLGYDINSTGSQFVVNPATGDGIAVWNKDGVTYTSEFMSNMGHFMSNAQLPDGFSPQILSDSNKTYLVMENAMMGGFGLSVYQRTGADQWSDVLAQLHRMNTSNAYSIYKHFLLAIIDGQQNIRAIWIEDQAGIKTLRTATFFAATASWGVANEINSNGVMLDKVVNGKLVSMAGNNGLQLVVHEQDGSSNKAYSIAYDATGGWQMPMRLDTQATGISMVSAPQIAENANGDMLVAWVETDASMTATNSSGLMNMLVAKTFMPGMGWSTKQHIAHAAVNADVSHVAVAVTSAGDASVAWIESIANGSQVLASHLVAPNTAWSSAELVGSVSSTEGTLQVFAMGMDNMDMPVLLWATKVAGTVNDTLQVWRNSRLTAISDAQVGSGTGDTTNGSGDGHTGHDHGTGTDTGSGTDTGTGGDTGTGTGNNDNTGSGGNSGSGGVVEGLWGASENIAASQALVGEMSAITDSSVQVTEGGNVFSSWRINSNMDMTSMQYANQDIVITRGIPDGVGSYSWSDPTDFMFKPRNFNASSKGSQFVANVTTGDGIAVWNQNATTFTSEFMNNMGHFMSYAELPDGLNPQILTDSIGQVYLLMETEMMGGFGLSVYERTGADQWSTTPAQLHRMDMSNTYSVLNHFRISTIDGENNLRVIWIEQQAGSVSLQSATYFTATQSWSSVVEVLVHDMFMPDKIVGGIASGTEGSSDLQLVLHEQNADNNAVYALSYNSSGWQMPMRLDMPTTNVTTVSAPAIAQNHHGDVLLAWVETDSTMPASNTRGLMHTLVARSFMPGMGWGAKQAIAHAAMTADAGRVSLALNHDGEATAVWVEAATTGAKIMASHWLSTNSEWSQKEVIADIANTDIIQTLAVNIDLMNMPIVLWGTKQTDGVNDTLQIWRNSRSTSINDAIPPADTNTGSNTGSDNGNDTGTGTDTGTGNDAGTDTGTGTGNNTSATWTVPALAMDITHDSSMSTQFIGPEIVRDDLGNNIVHLSLINTSVATGASVSSVDNHMKRNNGVNGWQDILAGSGLLDDLSENVMLESMQVVPSTGNLFGLLRDGNTLYLARYLANSGWSKLEIPDVPANVFRQNLQLSTNETGMVTVTWHEPSVVCCTVDIHAKHYMLATGWQETETISVAAQAVLTPHYVDESGNVQAAWLEDNADLTTGGFNIKLASYTPMTGWSETMDGPTGVRNAMTKTVSSGEHKMVIVPNLVTNTIDAYVVNHDGSWSLHANINRKMDGDGVTLINPNDIQVISGGTERFMVAWREAYLNTAGSYEVRYMTATAHHMLDATTGMEMWHWMMPSQVSGDNSGIESNINFAMDAMGNAYAVWNSVDLTGSTSSVFVNHAGEDGAWAAQAEMLAQYDVRGGHSASRPSIDINGLNEAAITWDQHIVSNSMTMHKVWVVEKQ